MSLSYNLTKEVLEDLYVKQKLSLCKCGKQLNCHPSTIRNNLLKFNIPIRTSGESRVGLKASDITRQKMSYYQRRKVVSDETKKRMSIAQKGLVKSDAHRKHNSEAKKRNWQDPEYRRKQETARKNSCSLEPNKPESFLISLLAELYPNQWQYTGDFSYWINGKNPDFVNFNTKQVIEHFGDYWHKGRDPEARKEIFAREGWDTLVIWEHELKNLDEAIYKIKKFVEI